MSLNTNRSGLARYRLLLPCGLLTLGLLLPSACGSVLAAEEAKQFLQRESVRSYIRQFSAEHDLNVNRIAGLFTRLNRQQSILDAISRPAEQILDWREYRSIFLTEKRINSGKAFSRLHEALLTQAQAEYGVPPEIITAIIGVETYYGTKMGSYRVLEALATLAFDYPSRSEFFTREMTEFILLSEKQDWDTVNIRGSYAGAMGMPQFTASSYQQYAVDFDGDGRRNLFTSEADIIGSVANYLAQHGWREGEPIAERWIPEGGITSPMRQLVRENVKPEIRADTLISLGFDSKHSAFDADDVLSVMTMNSDGGSELWVGYQNFYVITRYNQSRLYAMAVLQLAEAIRDAYR